MDTIFFLVLALGVLAIAAAYLVIERPTEFTESQRGNMNVIKDDWHKPRANGDKLTMEEIAKIRVAYNCGRKPRDIARELQCSTRTCAKYFGIYRGEGRWRRITEAAKPAPTLAKSPSRFYKSNFELDDA